MEGNSLRSRVTTAQRRAEEASRSLRSAPAPASGGRRRCVTAGAAPAAAPSSMRPAAPSISGPGCPSEWLRRGPSRQAFPGDQDTVTARANSCVRAFAAGSITHPVEPLSRLCQWLERPSYSGQLPEQPRINDVAVDPRFVNPSNKPMGRRSLEPLGTTSPRRLMPKCERLKTARRNVLQGSERQASREHTRFHGFYAPSDGKWALIHRNMFNVARTFGCSDRSVATACAGKQALTGPPSVSLPGASIANEKLFGCERGLCKSKANP